MFLSHLIKQLRKERQMTQAELAVSLHVTQQAIANYESGRRSQISPPLALRIEQATGGAVTRDELLFPELYQEKPDAHSKQDAA